MRRGRKFGISYVIPEKPSYFLGMGSGWLLAIAVVGMEPDVLRGLLLLCGSSLVGFAHLLNMAEGEETNTDN